MTPTLPEEAAFAAAKAITGPLRDPTEWELTQFNLDLSALEPSAARELALEALKTAYASMDGSCSANHRIAMNTVDAAIRSLSSPDHADAGKVEGDGWLPIDETAKSGRIVRIAYNRDDVTMADAFYR
ncbi:hypothetical protein D7027_13000, partial [Ochrobactrum intermedium]|uniref:hypothetical protein n=1 Tax=Brucella intermedia TaxID=94625 RepID=UPI0012CC346F